MLNHLKQHFGSRRTGGHGGLDIARHIGPGLLVTVGFIDRATGPPIWPRARSLATRCCGSSRCPRLCSSCCSTTRRTWVSPRAPALPRPRHVTSPLRRAYGARQRYLATIATAMAEVLGGAIALQMLFGLPVRAGCVIVAAVSMAMLMTNSYKHAERWIIAFVGVVGLSFLAELALVKVDWPQAAASWITPSMPADSATIIVSVLGAVVMPHNLFLHSEVIQSMHFEGQGEQVIEERLRYELFDTLFSMGVGWAINSAMVILAATTFFAHGMVVDDLAVAAATLSPILGPASSTIFAVALLFAGLSSSVTAGMAAGTITAGMFDEEYDIHDRHSSIGVAACFVGAVTACLVVPNPFEGLIWSQALLSLQLPITVFVLIRLTSSPRVMANTPIRARSTRCS